VSHTSTAQFSQVVAAVQRTERLPGGEIRGLPHGRAIGGLTGLQQFPVELAEAEREWRQGRFRTAMDRVKQLETRFNAIAAQWNAGTSSLITSIRQGRELKNLEKLKHLKAAEINMQRLIAPAQKGLRDLAASISQDVVLAAREAPSSDSLRSYEMDDT